MRATRDITGQQFGALVALRFHDHTTGNKSRWMVRCDCGKEYPTYKSHLTTGVIKQCVDCGHAVQNEKIIKHGLRELPEYAVFHAARQRCTNPNDTRYHDYGGRGIKFLLTSIEQLLNDIGARPTDKHSIDRIDNDGHYEVGNLKWSTATEQAAHRRPRRRFSEENKEID